jgi:hypothetical protein
MSENVKLTAIVSRLKSNATSEPASISRNDDTHLKIDGSNAACQAGRKELDLSQEKSKCKTNRRP